MKLTLYLMLVFLCFSCHSVYLPNSHNVPMLSKAGEVQGHFSFLSGNNLQAAAAVTNHVAVMANGLYADSKENSSPGNKYTFGEFGVGYFQNGKYYIDLFGGFGVGKSSATDSTASFTINPSWTKYVRLTSINYNRYFAQFDFGLKRDHFQAAVSYRFSLIDFKRGSYNGNTVDINQGPVLFLEPAAVVKFPFDNFILSAQAGLCIPMNNSDLYYNYESVMLSTGIGFRIGYKKEE